MSWIRYTVYVKADEDTAFRETMEELETQGIVIESSFEDTGEE